MQKRRDFWVLSPKLNNDIIPSKAQDGCKPPCDCWDLNSRPPEEQLVLLTAEQSLQPDSASFSEIYMLEAFPQAVYLKKPLFSWGTDYPDDSVPLCVPQICWAISARHHRSCKAAQPKDTLPKAEVITKVRTELQKALHRNTWLSLANSHTSATTATLQPRLQDPEVQESHYISLAPWLDWNSICSLV